MAKIWIFPQRPGYRNENKQKHQQTQGSNLWSRIMGRDAPTGKLVFGEEGWKNRRMEKWNDGRMEEFDNSTI